MDWCIDNLNNNYNNNYLYFYRIYKKLKTCDKSLNIFIKLNYNKFSLINDLIINKNKLLKIYPHNTILYPYSYCPLNHLHGVTEINIRKNVIVFQCNICNSIIIPRTNHLN